MMMSPTSSLRREFVERGVHDRCRNHQPDGAGLLQLLDEIVERVRSRGAFAGELFHGVRRSGRTRRTCGRFFAGAAPCWRPSCRARSCRVASQLLLCAEICKSSQNSIDIYASACLTAFVSVARPPRTSLPRCTRNARRPRSASTAKSPRACAAFTTPKVYFCPGTRMSTASSQVICRKTPELGPPLYACPVE